MPEPIPRVTLMQISDLHFGEIDRFTGDAVVTPLARRLTANTSCFDGVLGHHARGLQHLDQFWRKIRTEEDPDAQVVVSGDVTSCGGWNEFSNADTFLSSTLSMPFGAVGLGFPMWQQQAIPGNHDHWPGKPVILGKPNPTVASSFLSGYPRVRSIRRGSGRPIHLITINTDSDVHPRGRHRLFAIGNFQSQLVAAKSKLSALEEKGIRVLALHHSWHKKKGFLRISRASRGALEQFLEQESISIILTGHVHTPLVRHFTVSREPSPHAAMRIWECRCGTTTQIDKISYAAKSFLWRFPSRDNWPSNSLLVHRILEDDAGIRWSVETYVRSRSGFVSTGAKERKTIRLA
jgi:3',5'-cyclic AMP phosphodiesterase CpdA